MPATTLRRVIFSCSFIVRIFIELLRFYLGSEDVIAGSN